MARTRGFPVPPRGQAPVPLRPAEVRPARARPAGAKDAQVALPLELPAPPRPGTCPAARPASAMRFRPLWFCVHLPRLALEAVSTAPEPFALLEERQGVYRVLLANARATEAGVVPGLSSNAALALVPGLLLDTRNPLSERQVLERLAERLEEFSSLVSLAGDDVLLLEIAGSLRLYGGLKPLREQLSARLRGLGFTAALAIAPTPLAATWLAKSGRRTCVRAPENLPAVLREVPLGSLDWPAAAAEALAGIGATTVGDCLRLPREGFARRFGAARLLDLDRALGRLPDPRQGWRAPDSFAEDYEFLEEQSDRDLLLAACANLLQRLERFLLVRQLGTQRLDFSFYHLRAEATTLSLGCAGTDRSAARWLELLRLRCERVVFTEPVIAVRLHSGHTETLETGTARLAFDSRRASSPGHSILHLAERLGARLGRQSVHGVATVADHRPQHAWAARGLKNGSGTRPAGPATTAGEGGRRPLWMLPEPARLPAEHGNPVHLGELRFVAGPERLETGWWDDDGIARDYYTAVNPRGMRLWIFRDRQSRSDWYLHGFFG